MMCEDTCMMLWKIIRRGINEQKKERLCERYAQFVTRFCKVNISLWLKIKQDTSRFYYTLNLSLEIGK